MIKILSSLIISGTFFALQGCASFYSEKAIPSEPMQTQIKKSVNGATAKLVVMGGRCSETPTVQSELSKLAGEIGLKEVSTSDADYYIVARIARCDGLDASLYGKGANVMRYALFAFTVMTVPYYYDEDVQIELSISRRGKELYKGQQGAKALVVGGWLLAPAMITNIYGKHTGLMVRNILVKQLKEIEEQGVFQ